MEKPEADQLFQQAMGHQQAGRLPEARTIYEQILAAFPAYPRRGATSSTSAAAPACAVSCSPRSRRA